MYWAQLTSVHYARLIVAQRLSFSYGFLKKIHIAITPLFVELSLFFAYLVYNGRASFYFGETCLDSCPRFPYDADILYKRVGFIKMKDGNEVIRLTKENNDFRKIIETQQNTINRMVDYFILGKKPTELQK